MHKLVITHDDARQEYLLPPGTHTLGRSSKLALRVDVATVSSRQVEIVSTGDVVRVRNLSQYGSRLGGIALEDEMTWSENEVLEFGTGVKVALVPVEDEEITSAKTVFSDHPPNTDVQTYATRPYGPPKGASESEPVPEGDGPPGVVRNRPEESGPQEPGQAEMEQAAEAHVVTGDGEDRIEADDYYGHLGAAGEDTGDFDYDSADEYQSGDSANPGTQIQRTRIVDTFELEAIRRDHERRLRSRWMMGIAALLLAAGGIVVWFLTRPREPQEVTWPRTARGQWHNAFIDGPSDDCQLVIPGTHDQPVRDADSVRVRVWVGHRKHIPLDVVCSLIVDRQFLTCERGECARIWMQACNSEEADNRVKAVWDFDEPIAAGLFVGPDNGIPFLLVRYVVVRDDGSWFGAARLLRFGCRLIVLRVQVEEEYYGRAEELLNNFFMRVSPETVATHWEPLCESVSGDIDGLLARIAMEMERDAPATWYNLTRQHRVLLTEAMRRNDNEVANQALRSLAMLRQKQKIWYQKQYLAFQDALAAREEPRAKRIRESLKVVFTDPLDQRFSTVRKLKAEL